MGLEDKQILISGGVIAVFGIAVIISLLITPSFSGKDTQFFVTNTVNATNIALGDLTDVVLFNVQTNQFLKYNGTYWINANNTSGCTDLDCLTDVIISSPSSGQFLKYNGSKWVNVSVPIYENNTASNIGTFGTGLFAQKSGVDLQFKKLLASTGITITSNSTNVIVTNNGVTSITANSPLSASASIGSITLSCPTCITTSDTNRWQQLAQCQSNSSATVFSCAFTAKQHLYINVLFKTQTSTSTWILRFNNDANSKYLANNINWRSTTYSNTQDGAQTTSCNTGVGSIGNGDQFGADVWLMNFANGDSKHAWGNITDQPTGGSIPNERLWSCNYDNTTTQINRIDLVRSVGTGTIATGEITVWGYN